MKESDAYSPLRRSVGWLGSGNFAAVVPEFPILLIGFLSSNAGGKNGNEGKLDLHGFSGRCDG